MNTTKIRGGLEWRLRRFVFLRDRFLALQGPDFFIHAHWPWPMKKPWERARLRLVGPGRGIGDELMCTPIFREIKRRNPCCKITFIASHLDLFVGNPNIDELIPYSPDEARRAIMLGYNHAIPPPRPLISLMAECVGIKMFSNRLDCAEPPSNPEILRLIETIPTPRIVIQTKASDWTPNKEWPAEYWQELIQRLAANFWVIEVGVRSPLPPSFQHPRMISLVGKTELCDFVAVIKRASIFVGPVSGGMHIANAFRIPAFILFGGYESPRGFAYSEVTPFFRPCDCFWKTTPCPNGLRCMRSIKPEQVANAVYQTLHQDLGTASTP